MAKWDGFQGALSEVERLRVELERAQRDRDAERFRADVLRETALRLQAERDALIHDLERLKDSETEQLNRAEKLQAERDDLTARLQSIQQAERTYTAAKLHEAAKMRKGEAL